MTHASSRSGLKVLVAGIGKDERAQLESRVRQALGPLASQGPWSVSLVKLGGKWSVTVNGPGKRFKSLSFTSDDARLQDAIRDAVGGGAEVPATAGAAAVAPGPTARAGAAPAPSPARSAPASPSARPGETRDSHVCPQCQKSLIVIYEWQPGESKVKAPLACPHCWQMTRVEVGAWAAEVGDYRAEKA
jgi:hypothetical protein